MGFVNGEQQTVKSNYQMISGCMTLLRNLAGLRSRQRLRELSYSPSINDSALPERRKMRATPACSSIDS
jgi:hypothetical protein